ncbi:MAG: hypothetical protein LBQ93_05130 [Treponema sp.]|jgi:hypothetical protein|nr:hypothetical protein [Treponema sp.]
MQKAIKFLGIVALVAVIGFAMVSCKDEEEDTYTMVIFDYTSSAFNSTFGRAAPSGDLIVLLTNDLQTILNASRNTTNAFDREERGGVSRSELSELAGEVGDQFYNKLDSDGYVAFAGPSFSDTTGRSGVAVIYK